MDPGSSDLATNAVALFLNVALLLVFYLIARVLNARQTVALAFVLFPLLGSLALLSSVA